MCGIAGIVGPEGSDAIAAMTLDLRHRGPDGYGWTNNQGQAGRGAANIGATRLAILDPEAPGQPMYNDARTICLVFNGEIYNHTELRAQLIGKGHTFRTRTDTEVVLHLFEEFGRSCVNYLRGMFALAVLSDQELLLARDRYGIKPLLFAADARDGVFRFASEAKVLLRHRPGRPQLDMRAFANWIVLGHLVGDQTWFEGVRSLPAGHTMRITFDRGLDVHDPLAYHTLDPNRDRSMGYQEAETLLEAAFEDVMRCHLAADVEVGFLLSGGIDSTLLALFAREQTPRPLKTFSVADHAGHPDARQAEAIAALIGAHHCTHIIGWDDYLESVPDLVKAEEGPASLFGLPLLALCQRLSSELKAGIIGEGADELFGGYPEYLNRGPRLHRLKARLEVLKQLGVAPTDPAVETITRLSTAASFDDYLQAIFAVNLGDPLQRLHLDVVDRCAMSVGVELRVPYVDDEMVSLGLRIPTHHLVRADLGVRKYILRRLALKRFGPTYGECLIDTVLREKLGAPSAGVRWLVKFQQLCEERLPADYLQRHELGFCFTSKRQLLLFDYFQEAFLRHDGDFAALGGITEFMADRSAPASKGAA